MGRVKLYSRQQRQQGRTMVSTISRHVNLGYRSEVVLLSCDNGRLVTLGYDSRATRLLSCGDLNNFDYFTNACTLLLHSNRVKISSVITVKPWGHIIWSRFRALYLSYFMAAFSAGVPHESTIIPPYGSTAYSPVASSASSPLFFASSSLYSNRLGDQRTTFCTHSPPWNLLRQLTAFLSLLPLG